MDTINNLTKFLGTWTLLVESCKYEQGVPPVSATHVFSDAGSPNLLHFVVHWEEVDGKENHSEYDVLVDGSPHEINFNGYKMTVTASATEHKFKVFYEREDCTIEFECDSATGLMQLLMKNLLDGKWYNLHQTYRK